ncbi:MAG: hypothetical protein R2849_23555 [Thermomicrobiales bacterium]
MRGDARMELAEDPDLETVEVDCGRSAGMRGWVLDRGWSASRRQAGSAGARPHP